MTHLRGGSWINNQDNARAVYRNNNHPANRNNNIGFRLVVVRPTPPSLFIGHLPVPAISLRPLANSHWQREDAGLPSFIRDRGFRQCWLSTLCQPRRRDREGADESRPHGRNTPSGAYTAKYERMTACHPLIVGLCRVHPPVQKTSNLRNHLADVPRLGQSRPLRRYVRTANGCAGQGAG